MNLDLRMVAARRHMVSDGARERLIMVFLGWGAAAGPFRGLAKPGYDVMLLNDYRQGDPADRAALLSALSRYREIVVVGWSYGVVAATYIMGTLLKENPTLPVTRSVAVNGTPWHIDRRRGIAPGVFALTLRSMSPDTVERFEARMFLSPADADDYRRACGTERGYESRLAELRFFGELPPGPEGFRWEYAVVGERDLIFPPAAQRACWHEAGCAVTSLHDAPHFIDLGGVLDTFVVDKELVAERFGAARSTYRDSASVQRSVAGRLWQLTAPLIASHAPAMLEVGVGEGLLTDIYTRHISPSALTLWDIAEVGAALLPEGAAFERVDAEEAARNLPAETLDLVITSSTLQWFHSPYSFINNALRALRPGGLFAAAFFGAGTYAEVAAVTGVSLRYPEPGLWHFGGEAEVLVDEGESVPLRFADAAEAVRHISATGVNALRRDAASSVAMGRRLLRGLRADSDGRVTLTYHPHYLIIRKTSQKTR